MVLGRGYCKVTDRDAAQRNGFPSGTSPQVYFRSVVSGQSSWSARIIQDWRGRFDPVVMSLRDSFRELSAITKARGVKALQGRRDSKGQTTRVPAYRYV